ncbi:hypothetical protein BD779DRAFT_1470930 [Infundibulicybe gibba]|nr:hypothetical protein BD779DRAFT_1470930 [Infundibulicybe gibba]
MEGSDYQPSFSMLGGPFSLVESSLFHLDEGLLQHGIGMGSIALPPIYSNTNPRKGPFAHQTGFGGGVVAPNWHSALYNRAIDPLEFAFILHDSSHTPAWTYRLDAIPAAIARSLASRSLLSGLAPSLFDLGLELLSECAGFTFGNGRTDKRLADANDLITRITKHLPILGLTALGRDYSARRFSRIVAPAIWSGTWAASRLGDFVQLGIATPTPCNGSGAMGMTASITAPPSLIGFRAAVGIPRFASAHRGSPIRQSGGITEAQTRSPRVKCDCIGERKCSDSANADVPEHEKPYI